MILTALVALAGLLAQTKQPAPRSQAELDALKAMFGAQTADERIKAAEALLTNYADTDFKDLANYITATAYQSKGDAEKQIIFLERTLAVNPKHFQAMVELAESIAQRTKEFDFDREEKLKRSDKLAADAIALLKDAPKPNPALPDAQWEAAKKDLIARCYQAVGLGAMVRKKNDEAIAAFKAAIDSASSPEPAFQVRLAQAYAMAAKNDEAIALCEQIMNNAQAHPQVKQVAQAIRAAAVQNKASGAKPATAVDPNAAVKVEVKNP
jgi:tetratricopeptide (TPR) repeat protein